MYFEKAKLPERRCYKTTANQKLLESFLDSGLECAKVRDWEQSTPQIAANAFRKTAKRYGLRVDVFVHDNEVYLVRKEMRAKA